MHWKRTLTAGALAATLLLTPAAGATLTVAGVTLPSTVTTQLINNRTYVPLRAVAEQLAPAARVAWSSGRATVTGDGVALTAQVGAKWVEANGRCFYVADGVKLMNGSVMVPVRALAAALGSSVDWNAATGAVTVTPRAALQSAPYTEDELYWLARIISAESQGEPLEGKLAVGTVVLNRVASAEFPDTIYDVIFDRRWGTQFTPVDNGTIYDQPTQESVIAAKLCLEGTRMAGDSLYFLDPSKSTNLWAVSHRSYVTTIGCHQFYA